MKITLVRPRPEDKENVMNYKKDFIYAKDQLHGTAMLDNYEVYEEWYADVIKNSSEETVAKNWVPGTMLLAYDENHNLVGMINIRHRLNDYLLSYGGHIGYSVHPAYRQKGVATSMLSMAKKECQKLGIKKRLVTCDKTNIASAATIRKNGGILENEVYEGYTLIQRYWIDIF